MKIILRLNLRWTLLIARSFSSQPELQKLVRILREIRLRGSLNRILDDLLHVAALGADNPACNLEVLLVFDLNFVSTSQFVLFMLGFRGLCSDILVFEVHSFPIDRLCVGMILILVRDHDFLIIFSTKPRHSQLQIQFVQLDSVQEFACHVCIVVTSE